MASLPQSEIAFEEAHINDNLSTTVIAVCNVFTALAFISLLTRLMCRRSSRAPLGLDDYLAVAAMIPLTGLDITASLIAHYGIGRRLLWVAQDPKNFIRIGKAELAFSVFYDWSMALGKLSILALLARVFTLHNVWFKVAVYFWATWTVLWWTAGWFIIFLECRPLSTNWGVPTQCRPAFKTSVATSIFNSISDLGILILPQSMIWRLHLPSVKRFGLSILFLLGAFAAAISIARIPLLRGANSGSGNYDSTYNSVLPVIFTVIEPASVLICACLPMIQGLMIRLSKMKLVSYLSLSLMRSSRGGKGSSANHHSQPVAVGSASQQGQWSKLDDGLLQGSAKHEGHRGNAIADEHGNEEYELTPTVESVGRKWQSTEARDLV